MSNDSINFGAPINYLYLPSKQCQTERLSRVVELNTTAICFPRARYHRKALQKLPTTAHLHGREPDARLSTRRLSPKSTTMARRYQDSRLWRQGDPPDSKFNKRNIKTQGYRFAGRLSLTWSKTHLPEANSRPPSQPLWTVAPALWYRI